MSDERGQWRSIEAWILDAAKGKHRKVKAILRHSTPNTTLEFPDEQNRSPDRMKGDSGEIGLAIFDTERANLRAIALDGDAFFNPIIESSDGACVAHEGTDDRHSVGSHSLVFTWQKGNTIEIKVEDDGGDGSQQWSITMTDTETRIELEDDSGPQTIRLTPGVDF